MSRTLTRARDIVTEIIVTSAKIAAALVVLYVLGTMAGCGGSVEGEPQDDDDAQQTSMTTLPVQCAPQGCAK